MNILSEAMGYVDECWDKTMKAYYKFQDNLIEYRKTMFASQRSDMWYLGYMLSAQKFENENVDIDDVLDEIRDGFEEGKMMKGIKGEEK